MTPKQEDQLLIDYFNPDDSIKVNCRWLQQKLRHANTNSRELQAQLDKALLQISILQNRVSYIEEDMPTYYLNTKV